MARSTLPVLSDADRLWLASTFARNHAAYAGWTMDGSDDADNNSSDKGDDADKNGSDKDGTGGKAEDKADDLGYPADTPVAEMTLEQQVAYHKHQSRKHEQRATAYRTAAGGKSADELKGIVTEAEQARRDKLTVDERALEDARTEGRNALLSELGPAAVRSAFDLLLPADMPQKEKDEHLDTLDLSKFLTDAHQVDTAKVRAAVGRISPDKGQGGQGHQRDWGQGRRGGSSAKPGSVSAVMEQRRAEREEKKAK